MRKLILFFLILFSAQVSGQINWVVFDTTNSPLPHNDVTKLVEDNLGNIWATTRKGLVKFDGVNWTVYDTIPGTATALKDLFALAYDDVNDLIYVSVPGRLVKFDGTNWDVFIHASYSVDNVVDNAGNVWMALYYLGIGKFDGTTFTYYDTTNSPLGSHLTHDLELSPAGQLNILSLSDNGLTNFDGTNWVVYDTSNSPIPTNNLLGLGIDNNGLLLLHGATSQNSAFLYSYDGNNWVSFDTTVCVPPLDYSSIKTDGLNRTWIGTYGEGLHMLTSSGCAAYTVTNSPIPDNYIKDILITGNTMWIATDLHGLVKMDLLVGIAEVSDGNVLSAYPNPAHSQITLNHYKGGMLHIYNVLGESVLSQKTPNQGPGTFDLDVSLLIPGLYLIKTDQGTYRMIKE